MDTLEYVTGSFVFRLQATANGYDSHVRIYSRRHFDNCLRNGTMPWAMVEIKVKTDNGEFIVKPEYGPFVDFCEDWITNPHATQQWARDAIVESEHNTRILHVHELYPDAKQCPEGKCEHVTQLNDFPYTVHTMIENTKRMLDLDDKAAIHTTNDYESTVNTMVENTRRILDLKYKPYDK